MNGIVVHSLAQGFCDHIDPLVIYHLQPFLQFFFGKLTEIIAQKAVHMLFQGTDGLHQRSFKIITDAHYLSGCLHLRGQRSLSSDKLIKGKTGKLHHTVIQRRFKACIGLARNGIFDLIKGIAKGNLGSHLGNGVARCLTCQCRRTAYSWIYFDHTIFKAGRVQRKLYVTASCYIQLIDNIKSRGTQHLIFLVRQSLGRRYNDTVSCMDAYGINILHVADSDTVPCTVAHHFIFDLLPSCNAPLHQNLAHSGKSQTVFQNAFQLFLIVCNTAAASAQRISRPEHYRISNDIRKGDAVLNGLHHLRSRTGLSDLFHGILKGLSVLCLFDGFCRRSKKHHLV